MIWAVDRISSESGARDSCLPMWTKIQKADSTKGRFKFNELVDDKWRLPGSFMKESTIR